MKTYLLSIPMLVIALWISSTSTKSTSNLTTSITMCHNTTQAFAKLADDPSFGIAHEDPQYSKLVFQAKGEMITYPVTEGVLANAYVVASANESKDVLFVVHEWYGLNDFVKSQADIFSEKFPNMTVIALDLYDGKVADNRTDAATYMQAVQTERALAIINGAKTYIGSEANVYTVGWCFGGGWSLQTAIEMGDQAKGAIMFYGMPETNMERLATLKCDVLGIFAGQDQWITEQVAADFKESMSKLPNELILKSYDADHGFANPSNPIYDEKASTDAYQEMESFIVARR
jgi:carboxymethylenebutenolidase